MEPNWVYNIFQNLNNLRTTIQYVFTIMTCVEEQGCKLRLEDVGQIPPLFYITSE